MRELKNKHVFVSCEVSNLGFKFARTLSCMPCIYWPHSADNGENPWNVSHKKVSNKHYFTNHTDDYMIPPTYDVVKKFFKSEKDYYTNVFDAEFSKDGVKAIDAGKRVIYVTNSMPDKLVEYFPNSVIFNLIQNEKAVSEDIVNYKIFNQYNIPFENLLPKDNDYYKFLKYLTETHENLSHADVWSYQHKKKPWDNKYRNQFFKSVHNKVSSNMFYRKTINNSRTLNVTNNVKWPAVKDFFEGLLDEN